MVSDTKFYDILAISPNATTDEISKSYKKIALRCHPDKTNHDPQLTERFKSVTRAYEVLKDDTSRRTYDMYGESGLDGRVSTGKKPTGFKYSSATDVFSQVFNDIDNAFGKRANGSFGTPFASFGQGFNSFGFPDPFSSSMFEQGPGQGGPGAGNNMNKSVTPAHNSKKAYKSPDVHHLCTVSLEAFANGRTIKLQLPRRTKCGICKGDGGFDRSTCGVCEGSGRVVTTMSNQFTKYQSVGSCAECRGTGALMSSVCNKCDDGYVVVNELLQLQIPPGAQDGDKVVLKGAADEGRDTVPGDVVVQLKQLNHPFLVRKFNDLYMEYDIDLRTALMGGSIVIKDYLRKNRDIRVFINVHGDSQVNSAINTSINEGEVVGAINPGTPKIVKGLGMPMNPSKNGVYFSSSPDDSKVFPRGNLFIKFNVKVPSINDFSSINDIVSLVNLLPPTKDSQISQDVVDVHLSNVEDFQEQPVPKRQKNV